MRNLQFLGTVKIAPGRFELPSEPFVDNERPEDP